MDGYLLDNNTIGLWFSQDHNVVNRVNSLPAGSPIRVSAIIFGEIEFGMQVTDGPHIDQSRRDEFERWMLHTFRNYSLDVTQSTRYCYGALRAALFRRFPPQSQEQNRPERCWDRATASFLDIDENDLWIAAQAMEHQLVLVTHDRMERIREAADLTQFKLTVDDWS